MVKRQAKEAIYRLAAQFPVIGITGPRQSGKTTLVKELFPEKEYVSFDDKNIRELAKSNPTDFLMAYSEGAIFDEAQKVPEIFDAIKIAVDEGKHTPGKYILTGSSQFRLKKNMSDSLAGRASYFNLLPFSVNEVLNSKKDLDSVYDLILLGQYPPLYDKDKFYEPEDWFDSYIDTYLDLDVKDEITPSNISAFKSFIKICAMTSGSLLSMDSISRHVSVSAPTVKSWLSILEASYIIHLLPVASNNYGKSLIKSPKLYFYDTGLLCHLLNINSKKDLLLSDFKGHIVETFAISELIKTRLNKAKKPKLSYFRDKKGFEVDVIADWERDYAIEIKSDTSPAPKHATALKKLQSFAGKNEYDYRVFYLGEKHMEIDGISYIPWKEWGTGRST